MKKVLLAVLVGLVFLSLSFSLALANPGKVNLKGEITAVDTDAPSITIRTADDVEHTIHFSPDYPFDFTAEDVGGFVQVKGVIQEEVTILATWVKPIVDEEDGDDGDDDGEETKEDSAYCSGEKETHHPVAVVLANRFDKEVEEIMGYFCDGFGIGQIYLALKTEVITGVDYGESLAKRGEGKGWGEVWEELGYKGKPKDDAKTPPGQDKDKDKDKDKGPDGDEPKDKEKDKEKDEGFDDDDVKEKKPKKPKKPKK